MATGAVTRAEAMVATGKEAKGPLAVLAAAARAAAVRAAAAARAVV